MASPSTPRGRFGWVMYDWSAQPFFTIILTFIFGPYFVNAVAANPQEGQTLWANAQTFAGLAMALTAPFLGAYADESGPRKPWVIGFSLLCIFSCWVVVCRSQRKRCGHLSRHRLLHWGSSGPSMRSYSTTQCFRPGITWKTRQVVRLWLGHGLRRSTVGAANYVVAHRSVARCYGPRARPYSPSGDRLRLSLRSG